MNFKNIYIIVLLCVSSDLLAKEISSKVKRSPKRTRVWAGTGYSFIKSKQLDRIDFGLRGVTFNTGISQNLSENIALGLDYSVFSRNKGSYYSANSGLQIQQYSLGLEYVKPLRRHLSLGIKASANFNQFSAHLGENTFSLHSYRETYGSAFGGSVFFPLGRTMFECSMSHSFINLAMPELGIDSKIGITSFKGSFGFRF